MPYKESIELILAKELVNEGKFDEFFQLKDKIDKIGDQSGHNVVSWHLLECEIFFQQREMVELLDLAEKIYKKSLKVGKSFLSVDALYYWAIALIILHDLEKAEVIIKQAEEILKCFAQEEPRDFKRREANIEYLKGLIYNPIITIKSDLDLALEHYERCLELREEFGEKYEVAEILRSSGFIYLLYKWDLNQVFEYTERALTLAKESKRKYTIAGCLFLMGAYYYFKGDLDHSIMHHEECLNIFKKLDAKYNAATVFNSLAEAYRLKGDLERALECSEQSIAIYMQNTDFGSLKKAANSYDYLIHSLIQKGDLQQAQEKLDEMEQIKNKLNDKEINRTFLFDKALLLKTSSRALNRGEAEKILKQCLEEEKRSEGKVMLLLNLTDLLLFDLQTTGEIEVLNDINSYMTQLLDITGKTRSYWILGEIYLLKAKLALLNLDSSKARRLLTKGQQIADNFGLDLLAMKISLEHDKLLQKLDSWENFKKTNTPINKRIILSGINEQIDNMINKRGFSSEKVKAELPIVLMFIQENCNPILIKHLTSGKEIDAYYLGKFLSSFNESCNQIFSKTFDRVKLGKYTVLINALNGFSVCYLFHGQTYSAQQKMKFFSEVLSKDDQSMEVLKNAANNQETIELSQYPLLEELITKSFESDHRLFQMPFVAYRGDDPFVFASYAHADKLDVYPIIKYLNKMNIKIWYDEGIPVSENWKKSIAYNLERCKTFLVFVSPQIHNSEYVKKEISFALKKHKPFFAVYLKETALPTELEFEMADIQAMMKHLMPKDKFYSKLKDLLTKSLRN
jgi:tetratricopeptide (TPR) repeat protein